MNSMSVSQILLSSNDRSYYKRQIPKRFFSDFVKTYYKHGLKSDEDGYYAAFSFAQFHIDLLVDYDQTVPLFIYMGTPSWKNAEKLLRSQNIQVPFAALLKHLKSSERTSITPRSITTKRGGMDEEGYTKQVSKKRKTSTKHLKTFIGLDTLKDIHPVSSDILWNMVSSMSSEEKEKFVGVDSSVFRKECAQFLSTYLDVSCHSYEVSMTTDPMVVQIEKDTILYRQMMKWMTNTTNLKIVIDGLYNEVNESGFIQQIMMHAFIHAMLTNIQKVRKYMSERVSISASIQIDPFPYTVKKITFLDGSFVRNDGMNLAPFKQKFVEVLKKEIQGMKEIVLQRVEDHATYFEKYYGDDPTEDQHWAVQGRVLNKSELQKYFKKTTEKEEVEDAAIRNFVRDAWKADVAIQQNALFFTCDKHALLYHKWICKKEAIDRNAIALFLAEKAFIQV